MAMNGELLVTAKLRTAKKARAKARWGGLYLVQLHELIKRIGQKMRLHPTKGWRTA